MGKSAERALDLIIFWILAEAVASCLAGGPMMGMKGILVPLQKLAAAMKKDKRLELGIYALLAVLGILIYSASCGRETESPACAIRNGGRGLCGKLC